MTLKQTPSQTVGPYFAYGLTPEQYGYALRSAAGPVMAGAEAVGEHITVAGQLFDGEGAVVTDGMIEVWGADVGGRYGPAAAGFRGFGRCGTGFDASGGFFFETVKPGSIGAPHAPHLNLIVFMRGLLSHAFTRLYFADEAEANAKDPVLNLIEPPVRRETLIAKREERDGAIVYRLDIRLQGERETVFFDV